MNIDIKFCGTSAQKQTEVPQVAFLTFQSAYHFTIPQLTVKYGVVNNSVLLLNVTSFKDGEL